MARVQVTCLTFKQQQVCSNTQQSDCCKNGTHVVGGNQQFQVELQGKALSHDSWSVPEAMLWMKLKCALAAGFVDCGKLAAAANYTTNTQLIAFLDVKLQAAFRRAVPGERGVGLCWFVLGGMWDVACEDHGVKRYLLHDESYRM